MSKPQIWAILKFIHCSVWVVKVRVASGQYLRPLAAVLFIEDLATGNASEIFYKLVKAFQPDFTNSVGALQGKHVKMRTL